VNRGEYLEAQLNKELRLLQEYEELVVRRPALRLSGRPERSRASTGAAAGRGLTAEVS
jgi:hypothetical protein